MPIIYRDEYGEFPLSDGQPGHMEVTPTVQKFTEEDGTDVRLDRVRIFDGLGRLIKTYLRDKMHGRFSDNLPDMEDDLSYLDTLPTRARR